MSKLLFANVLVDLKLEGICVCFMSVCKKYILRKEELQNENKQL